MARLAVVYASRLRMKIVTDLYLRPMSPSQFHTAFGGGSVSRVDYHFKKLAESGWLELIQTKTGGARRSATEHFYRANDLAVCDLERWSQLPPSIQATSSLMTLEHFTEQIVTAIEADTFDARPDRHLSWMPVYLDRLGWKRVMEALNDAFEVINKEQAEANLRLAESGEKPAFATVGLAGFESAASIDRQGLSNANGLFPPPGRTPVRSPRDATFVFPIQIAKVLADPLALQIISEANLREMSASQFRDEFGGGAASDLDRRFKRLTSAGWLEITSVKTGGSRRGAKEYFYRAPQPAIPDKKAWFAAPMKTRETITWRSFAQLRENAIDAIEAGTFDARSDRHLTWSLLRLDQRGWDQILCIVDAASKALKGEEQHARDRMASSGERPIPALVALTAFESPTHGLKTL